MMPAPSNNGPNFHRNSIESSSVRLRRRKDAPESKKRNFRHSGDFLMPPSEQAPVRSSNGNRRRSQEFRFLSSRISTEELMDSLETLDRKMLNRPRPATTDPFQRLRVDDPGSKSESELLSPSLNYRDVGPETRKYNRRDGAKNKPNNRRSFDLALKGSNGHLNALMAQETMSECERRSRSRKVSSKYNKNESEYDSMLETTTTASSAMLSCVDLSSMKNAPAIKKGLLWFQRDKLFSRWKERFFIVSADYLQCFKRNSSIPSATEMGGFIFKLKLSDVEKVELVDKRGSLTVGLCLVKDGRIWLRRPEDIREWYQILKECVAASKERKGMMKSSKEFWSKKAFGDAILTTKEFNNNNNSTRPQSHYIPRRTPGGGYTKEYGFIDLPKGRPTSLHHGGLSRGLDPKHGGDQEEDLEDEDEGIPPPPPQYSSGTSCSKDSSGSNKSRDSGIDSIEKSGRSGMDLSTTPTKSGEPSSSSHVANSKYGPRVSDLVIYRHHRTPSHNKKLWRRSDHCISDIIDEFPNIWSENEGKEREIKASQQHRRYSHFILPSGLLGSGITNPQVTKL